MAEQVPPRIEFPCEDYPIKVMGVAGESFRAHVLEVIQQHAPEFDPEQVIYQPSRHGRYESIRLSITATGVEQLELIFQDLKRHTAVRMVL